MERSTQIKALVVGSATVAIAHYKFSKDWKTASVYGMAAVVAYLIVTALPDEVV